MIGLLLKPRLTVKRRCSFIKFTNMQNTYILRLKISKKKTTKSALKTYTPGSDSRVQINTKTKVFNMVI